MNRKHWLFALVAVMLLAVACSSFALAEEDKNLKVTMALQTREFSEPKEITISISITNVGEGDLPGPVTLYYPNGKQVEEFGSPTLAVGASKSWEGKWKVTQAELDAGRITFKAKYSIYNYDGELVNISKMFSKKIIYTGGAPELTVEREIRPTTAQKDQEVIVTYHIKNTGAVDVTDVTIKENSGIASKAAAVGDIAAGGEETYTFTAKMGKKDLTSAATITCKAGGKTYTQKVAASTIKYGEVKLSATLTADKKGGAPGDTVKLNVKLKNSGKLDFTNVKLTDDNLGELFSGVTVKANETVDLEKEIVITETQEIQLAVVAENETGEPVETATGRITVIATDPTQQILLSLEAEADRSVVYEIPGNVRFTITVHNESAVDVSDINIRAVNTIINSFESIPAGESRSFTREMAISMPGTFQFTARCLDQLSQTLTFTSNPIKISLEQPTPVPTEAPIITPPAPQYRTVPQSYEDLPASKRLPAWTEQLTQITDRAKWILGGIACLLLLLVLIGGVRRAVKKSQSNKAMDHLDGANYREYGIEPKRNRRSEIVSGSEGAEKKDAEEEKAADSEDAAQDSGLMAETLRRLYEDAPADAGSPEAAGEAGEQAAAEDKAPAENAAEDSETSPRRRTKA